MMSTPDAWWEGSDDHRLIHFIVQHMTELHQTDLLLESPRYLDAEVDDLFRLILLENPSTGYRWLINHRVEVDNPAVKVVYDRFKAPNTGALGAPGIRYLTLKVVNKEFFAMHFTYGRAWEDVNTSTHSQFKLVFNQHLQFVDEL